MIEKFLKGKYILNFSTGQMGGILARLITELQFCLIDRNFNNS